MERAPQACSNLFSSYARGFVVFRNAHTRRRLPRAAQILSLFFEEGDTSPYIYTYIYIPRASLLGSSIRSRWCGPFAFASLRSRLHLLTHTPAPSPLPPPLSPRYCIMQPLIAVLSFTHAICCSRCNPCPVTASSVQSPSR